MGTQKKEGLVYNGLPLSDYQKKRIVEVWKMGDKVKTVGVIRNYGISFTTNCGDCIFSNLDNWIQQDIQDGKLLE